MTFANAPTPSHWATRICNEISWGELTNQRPRDQAASESQRLAVKTATHGRRTGESEHSLHSRKELFLLFFVVEITVSCGTRSSNGVQM